MNRPSFSIYSIVVIAWLLGFTLPAGSTELILKDGTVCTGTIISEDGETFFFQKGSLKVRINKLLVIRKDGIQYAGARVVPQKALQPLANPADEASSEPSSAIKPGAAWAITLKKGTMFTGRKISESKRVIVFESDGDTAEIFRNEIASIDSSGSRATLPSAKPPVPLSRPVQQLPQNALPSGNVPVMSLTTIASPHPAGLVQPKSVAAQNSSATVELVKSDAVDRVAPSNSAITSVPPVAAAPRIAPRVQVVSFDNKAEQAEPPAPAAMSGILPPLQPQVTGQSSDIESSTVPGALPRPKPRVSVVAMSGESAVSAQTSTPAPRTPEPVAPSTGAINNNADQLRVIAAPKFGFVTEKANRTEAGQNPGNEGALTQIVTPPQPTTQPANGVPVALAIKPSDPSTFPAITSNLNAGAVEQIAPLAIVPLRSSLPSGILSDPLQSIPPAPRTISPSVPPAVPPMEQSPVKVKRSDGRQELVLMDGTVFVGKISGQTDRVFAFFSEGASITILKRLVKSIDGEPFLQVKSPGVDSMSPPFSTSAGEVVRHQAEKRAQSPSMFRMLPSADLPQGSSVSLLIDSMQNCADPKCRSRAARYCGAMGPWAVSAIAAVAHLMSDTAQSRDAIPVIIDSSSVDLLLAPGLEAARALSQLGPQGEAELIQALAGNNKQMKTHAVFGLGTCFQESAEKAVKTALKDPDPAIRRTALGSLRVITAQPHLLAALGDVDPAVRSAAVTLLGKIADRTAVDRVAAMAKDISQPVRKSTATALGMFGVPEVSPALILLSRDSDNFVRAEAVLALGKVKDGATVDALLTMLKDPTPDVRAGAVDALGLFRDSRAIPSLYAALKDKNPTVRKKAQSALRLLTEISQLIAALDDESTTVRNNAAYVLWLMTGQGFGPDKAKWEAWTARKQKTVPQ